MVIRKKDDRPIRDLRKKDDRRFKSRATITRPHQVKYQIFVDRGHGLETDGCWLYQDSDRWYSNRRDAIKAARELKRMYDDCEWVVADSERMELFRI